MDGYDDKKDDQILMTMMKLQTAVGKLHFLKTLLQLVLSVAFLSIFLCHCSWSFSLFPHSFNVYFSTFLLSFFTHTLERKYMFLICNGILAFLAKNLSQTSEKLRFSADADDCDDVALVAEGDYHEPENIHENNEVEEESKSEVSSMLEGESGCLKTQLEEEDGDGAGAGAPLAANEEAASTEELNQKFEEFIRKMKEEIRIEAQQQLITV